MPSPDIRVFYWGKRGGSWNWWQSSYRLNGTEFTNPGDPNDSYPAAIPGPDGDYTSASMVSDSVFAGTGLAPFATVPIAIVNVGDASLEEFNLDVASHFWATGRADHGGGFEDTWWNKNKGKFGSAPSYTSSNGFSSRTDFSPPEEDNNLWFDEGLRVADPNGIDPLPDSENAEGSKWESQTSDIYDTRHSGFGFIRDGYGDATLSSGDKSDVLTLGNRIGIIGDPRSGSASTRKGFYDPVNYRTTGGYTGDEGVLTAFTRKASGSWSANEANVWRMSHVWSYVRGGQRKATPFGDYTIKLDSDSGTINGNTYSNYYIVNSNSDIMHPGRILRGYVYVSLYDKDQVNQGTGDPIISGGTGLEGAVFGRFFFSLVVFGRYYG